MALILSEVIAQRLRAERMRQKLSLQDLADKIDVSKGQIGKLERGDRELTFYWADKLCKGLGYKYDEFLAIIKVAPRTSGKSGLRFLPERAVAKNATHSPRKRRQIALNDGSLGFTTRDLPIKGRTDAKGQLYLEGGRPVGLTDRPPQLAGDRHAFATFAPADGSMSPKYEPGQQVYVSSIAPLRPGCGVLVIYNGGRALVRELVEVTDKGIKVRAYGANPQTIVILASAIESVMRILGAMDGTF
jgi:transcriptional regulator with XRE-family HTH domain